MQPISNILAGLKEIEGALGDSPTGHGYRDINPNWRVTAVWRGRENPKQMDMPVWPDAEEEGEDDSGSARIPDFDPVIETDLEAGEFAPNLDNAEGEAIRQQVKSGGMEALGWYVPFHNASQMVYRILRSGGDEAGWGVYVPVSGMAVLAMDAFGAMPVPLATKFQMAFHAILNHELFHFATEYAVAQAELAQREPWYLPARWIFQKGVPPYSTTEEMLANAYMLRAFRTMKPTLRARGKQEALKRFSQGQPPGYRDGWRVKRGDWPDALHGLAQAYGSHSKSGAANTNLWDPSKGYDWEAQFPVRPRIDWRFCPIHVVDDGAMLGIPPGWLSFFSRLTAIDETEKFRDQFHSLSPPIQRAWVRVKERLKVAITRGADFKKWEQEGPDVYSVRVNDNFRAHLRHRNPPGDWLALKIGNHKEMGHG